MKHPLHIAVSKTVKEYMGQLGECLCDPACGGKQQLPLFIGTRKGRDTRMCCVDLLVISSGTVKILIEIEESGFHPTKICGKLLQSVLATHFIHKSRYEGPIPYADRVLFIQVLAAKKFHKQRGKKLMQCKLIESEFRRKLPTLGSNVADYRLFLVSDDDDEAGLDAIGSEVASFLQPSHVSPDVTPNGQSVCEVKG